ncbi:39S ribosomal protein L48, mitochondrial isoform X1 [Polistes fuscatus]|uniref:39S ribosomal protein L48, mitochondrial isoform X1 n=1 Tax=Polistes fuscatus TaxID=30207 RepID=UPI001CAA336D|nr:39S ribosomal protein L48, mitochondrial isoform X1 [Polistes fuscatus]
MALNIFKKATAFHNGTLAKNILCRRYSLYEPDYLEALKPKVPIYPILNVQITGYVYPVLQSYQSFIHRLAKIMDIDVDDCWALPAKELKIQRYKPKSTVVVAEYKLNIYERNIQLADITATQCPLLIRILETTLPEGVNLNVSIFNPDTELKRYIPDKQLLDMKSQLQDLKKK